MLKTIKTNSNSQSVNNEIELKLDNSNNNDEDVVKESFQTQTLKLPLTSNECLSFYMPDFTATTTTTNTQLNVNNDDDEDASNVISLTNEESCGNSKNEHDERWSLVRSIEKANVLKEILSSEKKYLNDLSEIVEVNIALCLCFYLKMEELFAPCPRKFK